MKLLVQVDRVRCQSSGLCEAIAPQVFRVGDGGSELIEGVDLDAHADDVHEAIDSCPMEALRRVGPAEQA